MDAKTLRASILQMAIEGKLVPQLDEEPAVEQIGDAPEEVPFEIPGKWKWVRLSDIARISSPRRIHKDEWRTSGIPFLRAREVANLADTGKLENELFIDKSLFEFRKSKGEAPIANDIVLTAVGTLGKCYVVKDDDVFFCKDTNTLRLSELSQFSAFIKLLFSTPYFVNLMKDTAVGSTVKNLTIGVMKQYLVPLPPQEEQRRIVARLNELLPLVDKFGKAQEALAVAQKEFPEKLKASLLQEAIQGKLVPQLDEEPAVEPIGEVPEEVPFAIPEKWCWAKVSSIQTLVRGITFPASAKKTTNNNGLIQCLTTGSIQQKHRTSSDVFVPNAYVKNERQYLRDGDVVISSANSRELVGKNILWTETATEATFGGFLTVARSNPNWMTSAFSYIVYQYLFISGVFLSLATQTTNIANISNKVLANIAVPIPPIAEQHRIVARLNELLPLVDRMAAQITTEK